VTTPAIRRISVSTPVASTSARPSLGKIRGRIAERFGGERLTSAVQRESIAYGLALIGHSPDPDGWTVTPQRRERAREAD
jgi:hypothetical protein